MISLSQKAGVLAILLMLTSGSVTADPLETKGEDPVSIVKQTAGSILHKL